jgi:DNA gyrase/topoisomerase IV subunit A
MDGRNITNLKQHIKSVIDSEYREYSMYVIENRAIPSCIDGLKPVHRKLVYSMLKNGGMARKIKLAELGGGLSTFGYHHGEASATQAAVGMSQDCNFGSRLVQEAAAPRYIYSQISKAFKDIFTDMEMCARSLEEDHPEPLYYLPLIPWVLVNGIKGVAVGFATDIMPHNPKELTAACLQYIEKGKITQALTPAHLNFKGTYHTIEKDTKWELHGIVTNSKLNYSITELPIGYDREGYINVLEKLMEADRIQDYDDLCDESGFRFNVSVTRAQKLKIENNPIEYFKLKKILTQNLTTVNEHGKLKLFNTAREIVEYFCDFRLSICDEKVVYEVEQAKSRIKFLDAKLRFTNHVVNGRLTFKDKDASKLIDHIRFTSDITEESAKKIISIPAYSFTTDNVMKLTAEIEEENKTLRYWLDTTGKKEYTKALKKLKTFKLGVL